MSSEDANYPHSLVKVSVFAPNEFWDTTLASCRNRCIWTLNLRLDCTTFVLFQLRTSWKWDWDDHFPGWSWVSAVVGMLETNPVKTSHSLQRQGLTGFFALFSQGKMLTSYSVSVHWRKGVKTKENGLCEHGHPKWAIFFYPCALRRRKTRTAQQWLFSLCHLELPWEISRTPLWRKLRGTTEITLLLKVLMRVVGSVGCSIQAAFSLISGSAFVNEKVRQLDNFEFRLPQRKKCIWHPDAVALTILMEICWLWENLPLKRKWWKTKRDILYSREKACFLRWFLLF